MKIRYQVFVILKDQNMYGRKFKPGTVFHGVPKKKNEFVTKELAIAEAKEYWKGNIDKLYVRKIIFHPLEEVQ